MIDPMFPDSRLKGEMKRAAKLRHAKNEFISDEHPLVEFPTILQSVTEQAEKKGFKVGSGSKWARPRDGHFEIQTHQKSVEPHTDEMPTDVKRAVYFGLYPVKDFVKISGDYDAPTYFKGYCYGKQFEDHLIPGVLTVFNPERPHSLIYYGRETTFLLFTLSRARIKK